jgi:hypothetical protein
LKPPTPSKGYRREDYEEVIGQLLDRVSIDARTLAAVVGKVAAAAPGPDRMALKRIEQERATAGQRVVRDRDVGALQATMDCLDREEAEALRPPSATGIPAAEAVRYLRSLGRTWRASSGGRGRGALIRALFERVDALGFREMVVHLTPEAVARGLHVAIPERLELTVGYGRGERSRASINDLPITMRLAERPEPCDLVRSA